MEKNSNKLRICLALIMFFTLAVELPSYVLSNFYYHLDAFSSHVKNKDQELAKKEREGFNYFYNLGWRWRLGWLTDKYLFNDTVLYDAAYDILLGDNTTAIDRLKNVKNNYLADHITGIARFRDWQAKYAEGKSDASKRAVLNQATEEVSRDFERAIKNGPDSNFDDRFNYDLVSKKELLQTAFTAKKPPVKFILGFKGQGSPKPGDKKRAPDKQLKEQGFPRQPGAGEAKKKG